MDNAAILRRWFEEVWNQGREETIDELLAPDAVGHDLGGAGQAHIGPAAFKPFWSQLRGAFPDIRFSIEDVVAEGDRVAARWTATMTHRGDGLGIAATHKSLTLTGMIFLRIEGGRIREGWNNWDQLLLTRELGLPVSSEIGR
ncbi:MAG: ester cyclase [Alphaproteobacteria bacterium]